jgi:hypothetical protein
MNHCTVSLTAGAEIQSHLKPDAVICLAPGRYTGPLRVSVPVTIQASDGATLDAEGKGPVVHVVEDGIQVRLSGLTITGGDAEFGAGLLLDAYGEVSLSDCRFEGNIRGSGGGAAIGAIRGRLLLKNVRTADTQDMVLGGVTEAAGEHLSLGATLSIRDGAKVALRGGEVSRVTVRGTTTRKPELVLEDVKTGSIENHPTVPGVFEPVPDRSALCSNLQHSRCSR